MSQGDNHVRTVTYLQTSGLVEQVGLVGPWPYHFLGYTQILGMKKKAFSQERGYKSIYDIMIF